MSTVEYTPQSKIDIAEIALHIRNDNPKAADKLLVAIDATVGILANHPMAGVSREELAVALRSMPVRKHHNYIVFCRPSGTGINVIRVLHGARELSPLLHNR